MEEQDNERVKDQYNTFSIKKKDVQYIIIYSIYNTKQNNYIQSKSIILVQQQ